MNDKLKIYDDFVEKLQSIGDILKSFYTDDNAHNCEMTCKVIACLLFTIIKDDEKKVMIDVRDFFLNSIKLMIDHAIEYHAVSADEVQH